MNEFADSAKDRDRAICKECICVVGLMQEVDSLAIASEVQTKEPENISLSHSLAPAPGQKALSVCSDFI